MSKFILILSVIISINFGNCQDDCPTVGKYVMCYYGSWAQYRPLDGQISIEAIDPSLCTHLIYSFAGINLDGEIDSLDPQGDFPNANNPGAYARFNKLKTQNPCLKTLLAIGGWNEGSEKYSIMAATAKRREEFVDGVERFLAHFGFDGLDVDWEYPAQRGGIAQDKENFIELIKLLHERLSLRNRMLTVAVGVGTYLVDSSYDVANLCKYSDHVLLMGYDLQFPDITSTQAPIYREDEEAEDRQTLNGTVSLFLQKGCPPEKLVFGIPSYGRTFTLKNQANTGLGAPATGGGNAGPYTQEVGFLGYHEICKFLSQDNSWTINKLEENMCKYAVKGNQWIGYDDPGTVTERTQFAMSKKLAGVMFWSIDTDDVHGECHREIFPLLTAANKVFKNHMKRIKAD